MNPRSTFRLFFVPLILTFFGLSVLGLSGCGGGGRGENPENGEDLQILSIYPPSAAPGSTVSLCVTGMEEGEEPLFTVCNEPAATLSVQALETDITLDPNYEPCAEGTTEIFLTIPDICLEGVVEILAAVGGQQTEPVTFEVTTPVEIPAAPPPNGDPVAQPPAERRTTVTGPGDGVTRGPGGPGVPDGNPGGDQPTGCQQDYGVGGTMRRCADPLKPWCNTSSGSCSQCRNWNSNGDEDCRALTDFGPDSHCKTDGVCVRCRKPSECPAGQTCNDCPTGQTCGETNQCVTPPPPPAPPADPCFMVEKDETDGSDSSAPVNTSGAALCELSNRNITLDRIRYGAIKLVVSRATEASIYGEFPIHIIASRSTYNAASPEQRNAWNSQNGVWVTLKNVTEDYFVKLHLYDRQLADGALPSSDSFNNRITAPSDYRDLTGIKRVRDGDLVECWPEAQVSDTHYCEGLREHFPHLFQAGFTFEHTEQGLSRRIFRLRLLVTGGASEDFEYVVKRIKKGQKFVAAVKQELRPLPFVRAIDSQVLEPRFNPQGDNDNCKVEVYPHAPFLKVTLKAERALAAGVRIDYLTASSLQPITKNVFLSADGRGAVAPGNVGTEGIVFIPVKDWRMKVTCFVQGFGNGIDGVQIAKSKEMQFGSEEDASVQGLRIDNVSETENVNRPTEYGLTVWEALPHRAEGDTSTEDTQENCTHRMLRYDLVSPNSALDDSAGRCDAQVTWQFSQKLVVRPVAPPSNQVRNWTPPTPNGTTRNLRFPFAAEIKFAAYPDRNAGESNTNPPDCFYHFVASDYTGGGILLEEPSAEIRNARSGRADCRPVDEDGQIRLQDAQTTGTSESLFKKVTVERTYESKNVYAMRVRQFAGGSGGSARSRRMDLRYVSQFDVAPNELFESDIISDFSPTDGLINDPIDSNWTIQIPIKWQHLAARPTANIFCWGRTSDPYESIGGNYYYREGWIGTIPGGQPVTYGVETPECVDSRGAHVICGSRSLTTSISPGLLLNEFPAAGDPAVTTPRPATGDIDLEGAFNPGEDPHFLYTGKFRNCQAELQADGLDGRHYRRVVEFPSVSNRSRLLEIANGPNPDFPRGYYYTSDGLGEDVIASYGGRVYSYGEPEPIECSSGSDCPFSCAEYERPCQICGHMSDFTGLRCKARGFDTPVLSATASNPVYSTSPSN